MQGYNPDWSGIMQSQLMQGQAMTGLGQQLGGILGHRRRQQQSQAANQQMMEDINAAMESGSPEQIAMVSIKYPQARDALDASMKFKDQQTKQNFIETTFGMLSDPASAEVQLTARADYLDSVGADSTQTRGRLNMLRKDPERFMSVTEGMAAAIAPEQYNAWKKSRPSTPEPMTEYQAQNLADKRENTKLRAMEADLRRQQQAAASESNELKRQQLEATVAEKELKVQEQRQKVETSKKTADMGKQNALEAATIAEELLQDPGLDRIVGQVQARLPTMSGESQDVINKANRLQSLLTVDNLKLMSGVLTDRDIAFLTNVASGLNITDSGILGSEKGVRDRLQQISTKIRQGVSEGGTSSGSKGDAPQQAIDYLKANPQLKDQFRAKYGYVPEGV